MLPLNFDIIETNASSVCELPTVCLSAQMFVCQCSHSYAISVVKQPEYQWLIRGVIEEFILASGLWIHPFLSYPSDANGSKLSVL